MIKDEAAHAGLTPAETGQFLASVVVRSKGGSYDMCPDSIGCDDVGGASGAPAAINDVIVEIAAPALDQRHPQPLMRALGTGDRDLVRRHAEPIQFTAGTCPPEPHSL